MAMEPKEILDRALKLPPAARFGILAAVFVAIVGLYYAAFYTEKQSQLQKAMQEYQRVNSKLVETQNIVSQMGAFEEEVAQLREELARARDQLPPETRMDVLIQQLTRIGRDNGLTFAKIEPRPEVSRELYAEIPVDLEMQGKYHPLALFFSEVASQSRIMNIPNLALESTDDKTALLKAKFQLITYRSLPATEKKPEEGAKGAKAGGKKPWEK